MGRIRREGRVLHQDPTRTQTLGADLRALRKARGLTLQGMAEALGRSVGWMSQVERDMSSPSVSELRQIAKLLDVPISILFGQTDAPAGEVGHIVRAGARRKIGSSEDGLVEELLSPDLTDDFEVVHSTFLPGAVLVEEVTRPTQELGHVLSGRMTVWISGDAFDVGPGDSFRIREEPHRWKNPHDAPCVVVWVIAPPVY